MFVLHGAEDSGTVDFRLSLHMDWMEWGYLGLFMATFLAATVVPFSSEFVVTGMLAAGWDPMSVLWVSSVGNWLGGMSSYGLGRLGDWHRLQRWLRTSSSDILRWKNTIDRYGSWSALLCWAPFIGDLIAIGLGFFRVDALRVAILMFIGKWVRYALIVAFFLS